MSALLAALDGRPVERPLLAPLIAELAAEVDGLELPTFLADAGKRARILADLARSLPIDVLVVDSGGSPVSIVADVLQRLTAVVPAELELAVTVTGPATRAAASAITLDAAVAEVLGCARELATAAARVVIVREEPSADSAGYAQATAPLWGSLRFFRAAGVLHVAGAADHWTPVLAAPGPYLPVVDAAVADALGQRAFGLALPPGGEPDAPALASGRCALLTHARDLAGDVAVRDLRTAVAAMANGRS